jgi:organic hydroperoxide reductase OsmC/OhrA
MTIEHAYRVSAWWTSGGSGLAKCESASNAIHFSKSEEFGGMKARWSPEQLLLCALAASFTTAVEAVARATKFNYTDMEVEVEGTAERGELGYTFTEILVRPRLTVQSEEDLGQGMTLLRRASRLCVIARAIAVPQITELKVKVAKMPQAIRADESMAKVRV